MSTMFRSGSGENIAGIVRQMSHPAVRVKETELDPVKSHHSSSTSLVWKSAENLYQGTCDDDQKRVKTFSVREGSKLPATGPVHSGVQQTKSSGDSGFHPTASAPSLDLESRADMRQDESVQRDWSDSGTKDQDKKSLSKKNSKSSAKSEKSSKKFGKSGNKKDKKDKKSYSSGDSKANTDTEEQKHQIKTSRSISVNDRVGYEAAKDRSTDSGSSSTTYSHQYQLLKPNLSRDTTNSSYGGSSLPKSHKSDNLNVSRVSNQSVSSSSSIVGAPTADSTHLSDSSPVDGRSVNSSDHLRNSGDHYVPCNKISEESSSPPTSPISLVGSNGWQDAVQRQESIPTNGETPNRHRYQESSSLSNLEETSSARRTSRDISASDTEYLLHSRSDDSMRNGHKASGAMDRSHTEQFIKEEKGPVAGGDGGEGEGSVAVIQPMFVVDSPSSGDVAGSAQTKLRNSNSRSASPRPLMTVSGGESGGDDSSVNALKDSMSRSSESTRSTGSQSIVSQKEKSPPQGSSEKDKKSKKAWYNVLNPNYKSRSDDLKRLFKNLPLDERLLVDYSCALQKDILVHGRLYVTPNFLSFYSKIFGWETNLMIKFKEVVSMTKEKTALVIPNAIQITTHSDKHFFTTFSARDKAYLMLFRIWQNALMDQQMPAGELWQWVHSSYGDQLGLTSDDDDYIAPSTTEDDQRHGASTGAPEPCYVASSSGSDKKHSGVTHISCNPASVAAASVGASSAGVAAVLLGSDPPASLHTFTDAPCSDNNGDESKTTTGVLVGADGRPTSPGGDLRPPSVCSAHSTSKPVSPAKSKALSSKHSSKHSSPIKTLSTTTVNTVPDIEHSDSLDSDDQSSRVSTGLGSLEVVVCPVQKTHHVGREIVNTVYGIPIDSLFTLLFTNSKMMLEVHAIRKTTDVVASPWQSKDDGQQRLRQVTYTVTLPTSSFGPKVSHVTEIQVMSELTVPGEYYSVDAEATNAGIPYAESFLVSNHWCLTRESSTETRLAVYTSVKYKKSMWGFMKSVIDKNSYSGVEELLQGIDSALQQEVTEHANMRQRTRRRRRRGTVKLEGDSAVALPVGALPVATVPGAAVAGAVGVVKDKTKAKLPVNNLLVNRLLGPSSIRSATLPRVAPLGSGSAALSAAAWQSPTPDEEEQPWGWPRCRSVFTTLLLILLLLTNFLLFWRLTKLEDMVKVQPHYAALRGFMHLDPDIIRKEVTSDTMLQILQEQELSHVKMTEDWRNRISEAESLLHKAEGMLRGLHASIPAEQSAASRTLLDRIRSSSSVLQASLEGSNLKRSEHEPSLAFSFGADIESDSSHSRREL